MRRIVAGIWAVMVLLLLLGWTGTALHAVCVDTGWYIRKHEELAADDLTGLTMEGVRRADKALTKCLRTNDVGVLRFEDSVYGQVQNVFNEREIAHMVDVAALVQLLRDVLTGIGLVVFLMVILTGVFCYKSVRNGQISGISWRRTAKKSMRWGCLLFVFLAAAFAGICAVDFNKAFIAFHHLFFTNDLWLMDPATDLMIRLLPEEFFEAAVWRTVLLAAAGPVLVLLASFLPVKRRNGNPEDKQ